MIQTYIALSRGIIRAKPGANIRPGKTQVAPTAKDGKGIAAMLPTCTALLIHPSDLDLQAFCELLWCEDVAGVQTNGCAGLHGAEFCDSGHQRVGVCTMISVDAYVWAGTTPQTLLGAQARQKVGSFQPNTRPRCGQNAESVMANCLILNVLAETLR